MVPVEDVPAWPVAEIFPRGIPAELDEGGIHFCTMLTVQEIGPPEEMPENQRWGSGWMEGPNESCITGVYWSFKMTPLD